MEILFVKLSPEVTAKVFIHLTPVGSRKEINALKDDVCITLKIKSWRVTFLQNAYSNIAFMLSGEEFLSIYLAVESYSIPKYTVSEWDK